MERLRCNWIEAWTRALAEQRGLDEQGDVDLNKRAPARHRLRHPGRTTLSEQIGRTMPPRPGTIAPGRTTLSAALPAAVMRSAEHAGIDPQAAELVTRARRGGAPLDAVLQRQLEAALGTRLDGVRVHTGAEADAAARAIGARAFAVGDDVFFRDGAYDPQQRNGQQLIAHEVAHTVQARGASTLTGGATTVSQPGDAPEREADVFADAFVNRLHSSDDRLLDAPTQDLLHRGFAPGMQIQRQATRSQSPVYGPPVATGAGNDFDMFLLQFIALENAAIQEGYGFTDLLTAFRKLYYDSASAAKTYAGAVVGGGVWNILIPGAAGTKLPTSWTGSLVGAADYLRQHQVLNIAGKSVDIGHLLAGADAAKHPTSLSLAGGAVRMRSNQEAATFVGDLGSVVTEYIHGSTASFRDTAMVRTPALDGYYDGAKAMASAEDMAGNADSYALSLDASKRLSQNLRDYYAATSGGVNKRFTGFATAVGLGALKGTVFSCDTQTWRDAMVDQVFNSALAYAAGKGWKADVVNVFADPGPGIFTPTFWEMYFNISGWVVDIFVNRMVKEVAKE